MAKGLVRFGVEPHRARLGLAVLGPVGLHDERRGEAPHLVAADLADEVDAHGDVAPLVAAAELDVAAVVEMQAQEVVGLEQHVAELGVGDPLIRTLEAGLDGLLGHHLVDGEVLADVAQVLEGRQRAEPVGVVEQQGAAVVEVEELAQLGADRLEVALDGLEVEQLALVLLAARVADHARAASGEGDGPVARLLEPAQRAELHEVAHVEAVGRRVEAGVDREPGLVEALREVRVGHLVDQAAEGEVLRERGHASTLPYAGRLIGRMGVLTESIGVGRGDRVIVTVIR